MTFKEYFNLTKETTNSCLKICGIIFLSFYAVLAITLGSKDLVSNPFQIFTICFLAGNSFALLIWLLAFTAAYKQVKMVTKFYKTIPDKIKKQFGLELIEKPLNPKYNYLQYEFVNSNIEEHFLFNFSKELIWITLMVNFSEVKNLPMLMIDINKEYKQEKIELTAWGLRQKIKWKDWKNISNEKIIEILEKLTTIANKEHLKPVTKDLKESEIFDLVSA